MTLTKKLNIDVMISNNTSFIIKMQQPTELYFQSFIQIAGIFFGHGNFYAINF